MVRSEGNVSLKNPVTPPGIDPGTVRLVAQRLNHYATPGPEENCTMIKKSGTVSAILCTLQHIFCVQDTKYKQKSKVQELSA